MIVQSGRLPLPVQPFRATSSYSSHIMHSWEPTIRALIISISVLCQDKWNVTTVHDLLPYAATSTSAGTSRRTLNLLQHCA